MPKFLTRRVHYRESSHRPPPQRFEALWGQSYPDSWTSKTCMALISMDFPSVGATQNLMMAAALADGVTVIENTAREPEIDDLILLNEMEPRSRELVQKQSRWLVSRNSMVRLIMWGTGPYRNRNLYEVAACSYDRWRVLVRMQSGNIIAPWSQNYLKWALVTESPERHPCSFSTGKSQGCSCDNTIQDSPLCRAEFTALMTVARESTSGWKRCLRIASNT